MSGDVILLRPLWLLTLPVLIGFGWWLYRQKSGLGDWTKAANPGLLQAMAALGRIDNRKTAQPLWAGLVFAFLTVLALSGPAIERRDAVSFRNLDGVIFVLDASPSMTGADSWQQLQTIGRFGLMALGTRPGGLIVYGGDAYVATDVTVDLRQLGQTWSLIGTDTVPDPGSRPDRGLALALRMLQEAELIAGDVVLFTDGGGLGPKSLEQAELIAGQGARLSIISDKVSAGIETHIGLGGGQAFTLSQAQEFSDWLGLNARDRLELQDFPLLFWRDFGRYLLVLALLPALLLFRRRAQ